MRIVLAAAVVMVAAALAGCAPGTPDEDSWRDDAVRVTGDVGSAVATADLALRHRDRLFQSYVQTVLIDAEEAAGKAATRLDGVQPPDSEIARNEQVGTSLDKATSLLTDVRIAVVRRAPLGHFVQQLAATADDLARLESSLHEPPAAR